MKIRKYIHGEEDGGGGAATRLALVFLTVSGKPEALISVHSLL